MVKGINLITLLWTCGGALIPCDFGVYNRPMDGHTKNEHFRYMPLRAEGRGFRPRHVLFDGWYLSLENLKKLMELG